MNTHYAAQVYIPDYILMRAGAEYVEHAIERMKQEGAIKIFEEIYKQPSPVVVETHMEEWTDFENMSHCYRLHYRLTAVQTRNVIMPSFQYVNHLGKIEWKCPACGTINSIDATYCGELHEHAVGCGSPREKTRQEML